MNNNTLRIYRSGALNKIVLRKSCTEAVSKRIILKNKGNIAKNMSSELFFIPTNTVK